jgi:type IV fimbrial biogenesis protein FimT
MTIGNVRAATVQRGFTLLELMVTLAVLGVLAIIAVPAFNEASLGSKLSSYASTFQASLKIARSEAIKRNATVTMCRSSDGTNCATSGTWQQGWIVFNDADADGTLDSSETRFVREAAIGPDYVMSSGGGIYTLAFAGSGMSATTQTITLCRATPSPGSQKRTITLDATGRATVVRDASATTCP